MTIAELEERTEDGTSLCPFSAVADEIDTRKDKKIFVVNNPCYERIGDEKKGKYVRKECRGHDTSCPAHPNYQRA